MINKLEVDRRKQAEEDINERIVLDEEAGTVTASYEYLEPKLENLGNNMYGSRKRAEKTYVQIQRKDNVAGAVDVYVDAQMEQGKWLEVSEEEMKNEYRKHFVVYSFVEAPSR